MDQLDKLCSLLSDFEYLSGMRLVLRLRSDGSCEIVERVGSLKESFSTPQAMLSWLRERVEEPG